MTDQPALFPPTEQATTCPVCNATRPAGDDKTPACAYELERDGKRPKGCLNTYDPRHADIPF